MPVRAENPVHGCEQRSCDASGPPVLIMCLRFVFLLITRMAGWLRLARREDAWKTAELLLLRHQLAVLQRQAGRPRPCWAARALLAVLPCLIPPSRRHRLRVFVAPETILR